VGANAGVELQAQALPGCQQRQHRVGGAGGRQRDPALGHRPLEGRQRVATGRVEQLEGVFVALLLAFAGRPALLRHLRQVGLGGGDPPFDQEAAQALGGTWVLELVGEDRRHRHRQVARHLQHRQVGADHRVEQPLLTERIGPEALDVGHVAVQDDRQVPGGPIATHQSEWQTARKSRARSRFPCRRLKSELAIAGVKRS
jgi:hypothetical protein